MNSPYEYRLTLNNKNSQKYLEIVSGEVTIDQILQNNVLKIFHELSNEKKIHCCPNRFYEGLIYETMCIKYPAVNCIN